MEGDSGIVRYCMECGSAVEPDADFCYTCGSRRIVDVRSSDNRILMEPGHCPYCGHDNIPEAKFCASCGRRIGEFEHSAPTKTRLTSFDLLVIMAALVPGLFNVFGIGHLVARKYSRGVMYLIISAVFLYIRFASGTLSISTIILLEIIGVVIYLKQMMEIFAIVYRS